MRRGALLNEAQNIGMSPTSVAGGEKAPGNCELIAGFCGPGSVTLAGWFLVLISPCGGSCGCDRAGGCGEHGASRYGIHGLLLPAESENGDGDTVRNAKQQR